MHAHKLKATVSASHEVTLRLPEDFPTGEVEVIVLHGAGARGSSDAAPTGRVRLSIDDLVAARLVPPPGVGPVSLEDMERAIAEGATGRGGV